MKKIIYICLSVFLIIVSSVNIINYSVNTISRIENGKAKISIKIPPDFDYPINNIKLVELISNIASNLNEDIMYEAVDIFDGEFYNSYYKTNNTPDFVDIDTENNIKNCGTNDCITNQPIDGFNTISRLKMVPYNSNVAFFSFDNIASRYALDGKQASYYINQSAKDQFIKALQDAGLEVKEDNSITHTSYLPMLLLGALPGFLIVVSMIFYFLSEAKNNVLKKMEGYATFDVIKHHFKSNAKPFAILLLSALILNFIVVEFILGGNFISYLRFSMFSWLGCIAFILISFLLTSLLIFTQKANADVKGRANKKLVFSISWLSNIVFIIAFIFIMTSALEDISYIYTLHASSQQIVQSTGSYVCTQVSGADYPIHLKQNFTDFYNKTVDTYDGVLIECTNYTDFTLNNGTVAAEKAEMNQPGYTFQNYVTINENYLKINPIHKPNGETILEQDFDDNKLNLMFPESKKDIINDYISSNLKSQALSASNRPSSMTVFPASVEDINVIIYKDNETINSFNAYVSRFAYGQLPNPIIKLYSEKYHDYMCELTALANAGYLLNVPGAKPYETLLPVLQETGISEYILTTPHINDVFFENINKNLQLLYIKMAALILNLIALICLIVFSTKTYCDNYRDTIAVRKLSGYGFLGVYKEYLLSLAVSFGIMIVCCMMIAGMNPLIGVLIYLGELIAFYGIANGYTRKSILRILKGG